MALYYSDLSKKHIYEVMCKSHGYLPPPTGMEWDENQVYEWAQSDMYEMLNDDDGQRSYGPETAERYDLPFGCKESLYFEVTFGLYGRSGKHLLVESFEGVDLSKISNRDLICELENDIYETYSDEWCQHLVAMMDEWGRMFTQRNASAELEYRAADIMYQRLEDKAEAWRKALKGARAHHSMVRLSRTMASVLV